MSWQQIQINTFTKWCNVHLGKRGMHVDSLQEDLKDGLLLINLLEVLSTKPMGRYNKYPRVPHQKYENTQIAFDFMRHEGIKLVNIGNTDINDGNLKLILGLIWTLIIRYQIAAGAENGGGDGTSVKDDLLKWVQSKIPEYNIKGFTKDWNDGKALCALVDAIAPGLCPDHASLDAANKTDNLERGMALADERLGIPRLLAPEEMANPRIDEQSVMTYISYFRNAEPKDVNLADKCVAYGQGLIDGIANEPSAFTVETPPRAGELVVRVFGPKNPAQVEVTQVNGKYEVKYTPTDPGEWEVHVTLNGTHIPGSVFKVVVLKEINLGGEGKIRVYYSSTSSNEKQRNDKNNLSKLLERKEIHLRPDFEPWIAVDIMDKEDREALFKKNGTRKLPIVLIDDKYVGDYDDIVELEKTGELDRLLKYNPNIPHKG